jgi:prephenate dehydrogenase
LYKRAGGGFEVAVADASEAARKKIVELGYADSVSADPAEAVRDADLVVFAVPVMAIAPVPETERTEPVAPTSAAAS